MALNSPGFADTEFIQVDRKAARGGNSLVVFVHGIGGSSAGTWGAGDLYWPKLVKQDTDGYDVLVFDYDSSIYNRSRSIAELSRAMGDELQATGPSGVNIVQYENVVFIAHSLGVLIVRNYLLDNLETSTNVKGVFAFGGPMNGSYLANVASTISSSTTIEELKESDSVEGYVTNLVDRWLTKRPNITIGSWCAYETQPILGTFDWLAKLLFGTTTQVVNSGSARLLCDYARPIDGNHWDIVKPTKNNTQMHTFALNWLGEATSNAQPAVSERTGDIVFANCSDSPYGLATQNEMFRISQELAPGAQIRLSKRLPLDFTDNVLPALWVVEKPTIIIIHLSCFQEGPENEINAVERTKDFVALMRALKGQEIKVLVYSKAFMNDPRFRKHHFPEDLEAYFGTRAVFVPYDSNLLMSKNRAGRDQFRAGLSKLLRDESTWPH